MASSGIPPEASFAAAPGRHWLIAFSGGLDSSVLLHWAVAWARDNPSIRLRAIHVHHGLHADADRWAQHCRRQAADLDVSLDVRHVSVDRDGGLGLEAAAGLRLRGMEVTVLHIATHLMERQLDAAAGYLLLASAESLGGAAWGMALVGLSTGMIGAVNGAYWPEVYGTRSLGAIRALATSIMVFATALGPGVTGRLIDAGVDFRDQLAGMAVLSLACCATMGLAMWRAAPLLPARATEVA